MLGLLLSFQSAGDIVCQEAALLCMPACMELADYATVKETLVPKLHSVCLSTTAAAVRSSALLCMAKCAAKLDREEAMKMLQTATQVCSLFLSAGATNATFASCTVGKNIDKAHSKVGSVITCVSCG